MNYLQLPCEMWASVGSLSGLQLAIYCDAWTWRAQGNDSYRANSSLAEMFGVNERAIPRAVAKLVELGLVTTERRPDGRRAIIPVAPDQPVTRPIRQVTNRSGDQPVREGVTNLSGGDCPTGQGGGDQLVNQEENITNQLIEQGEEKGAKPKKEARPKDLQTVIDAFTQLGHSDTMAEQFFNHYEANGWRVGGKAAMKDWKAAARNWISRAPQYERQQGKRQPFKPDIQAILNMKP